MCVLQIRQLVILLFLLAPPAFSAETVDLNSLIQSGNYEQAISNLQKLAHDSNDAENLSGIYHQLGEIYYQYTHNYSKAITVYDQILRLNPTKFSTEDLYLAILKKGDAYCRMNLYDNAIESYQYLVNLTNPEHFAYQTGRKKISNIQSAIKKLNQLQLIIANYPNTSIAIEAKFQISELYRQQSQLNQPHKAIALYEALLNQHPSTRISAEAQWRIGQIYQKSLNQIIPTINAYRKVDNKYPTSNFAADALFQLGLIHKHNNQCKLAIKYFDQIIEKHPDFWKMYAVYYWMALCYEETKNIRHTINNLEIFVNIYLPTTAPAYFGEIGKYHQTKTKIESELQAKIAELKSRLHETEWQNIQDLARDKDYVSALKIAKQLIANHPDQKTAGLATKQLETIKFHAAIQNLRAHVLQTEDPEKISRIHLQIGRIYERNLQDYNQALTSYEQAIKKSTDSNWAAEARYRSALILTFHKKAQTKAITVYNELINSHPSSWQAMMANFQLGEIYRSLDKFDQALRAYKTTIAFPERVQYLADGYTDSFADRAHFRIGRVHHQDQRFGQAQATFKEFMKSRPNSPRLAAAYTYLAFIFQDQGNYDEAVQAYDRAIQLVKNDSSVQAEMIVNEAKELGFHQKDVETLTQQLINHRKKIQ